ncbi:MAG: VOC family protein [Solirubrobacterales bacterium]
MLHYASLNVSDLSRSAAFYDAVVAPLGWRRQEDSSETVGWGLNKPQLYVTQSAAPGGTFGLISLAAKSIPAVKASFESGAESGGEVVDAPGSSPAMGPGTYAARLRDPDGYVVEIIVAP